MRFPVWAGAAALLVSLALGLMLARAPSRSSSEFDLTRAQATVAEITRAPHVTGSPEHTRIRNWIQSQMTGLGLTVETQSISGVRQNTRGDKSINVSPVDNVIAVLPGSDRSLPAVALMAHYDSVAYSPGAGDDAAGVAALLETARLLSAGAPPKRDVIFIFTDAEELGLIGAQMFFKAHPLAEKIGAVVNVEARGSSGRAIMFQTSDGNDALVALWARHAHAPSGNSLTSSIYRRLPNDTDLTIAIGADKIAINGSFIDGFADYHMPTDSAASLDPNTLRHLGDFALSTTRALAQSATLPARGHEATYFDVFGLFVVQYPSGLGWLFCAVAAILLGWTIRDEPKKWSVLIGAGKVIGATALVGVAAHFIANWIYGDGTMAFRERLAEAPAAFWIWLALAFAALLLIKPDRSVWLGTAVLMLIVSILTQAMVPGASWLFVWPVLIALALDRLAPRLGKSAPLVIAIVSTLIFALLFDIVRLFYVSLGTTYAGTVALAIPFAALMLSPMLDAKFSRPIGAGLVAAAALGLAALTLNTGFSARHPKPGDLFHLTESGKSFWATTSKPSDLPGGEAEHARLPVFRTAKVWRTPAPPAAAPKPITGLKQDGETVTLNLQTQTAPHVFVASIEIDTPVTDARVNGEPVTLNTDKPTRIFYRASASMDMTLTFTPEGPGTLSLVTLLAEEGLPPGAPDPGGPPVNWTWLSHTRSAVETETFTWP